MMKFHHAALSAILALGAWSGAAQAGCGGAYPAVGPDGYPAGYVLVPNWAAEPCVPVQRKTGHRKGAHGHARVEQDADGGNSFGQNSFGHDPFGTRDLGWYNKDSLAARGTEYDPRHPDPSVVSDAH